jgi:hypothetical protein
MIDAYNSIPTSRPGRGTIAISLILGRFLAAPIKVLLKAKGKPLGFPQSLSII